MNPVDAIRLMARHYPGGIDALAVLCGKSPETLRHEIGGNDHRYKLGVTDACTISEACLAIGSPHARTFVNAINSNCGGFVKLEVRDMASGDIHGAAAGLVKECSDVVSAVAEAMRDGSISANDKKSIERELRELLEQIQVVDADLQTEADKPVGLRRAA